MDLRAITDAIVPSGCTSASVSSEAGLVVGVISTGLTLLIERS